jgi:hypothetical protein
MAGVVPSGAAPAAVHDLTLPHTTPDQIAALEPAVCVGEPGEVTRTAARAAAGTREKRPEEATVRPWPPWRSSLRAHGVSRAGCVAALVFRPISREAQRRVSRRATDDEHTLQGARLTVRLVRASASPRQSARRQHFARFNRVATQTQRPRARPHAVSPLRFRRPSRSLPLRAWASFCIALALARAQAVVVSLVGMR